jgi:glutamine synthetase
MAQIRFKSIEQAGNRILPDVVAPSNKISDYFGVNAFGLERMKETLSPDVYKKVKYFINKGK